MADRVIVSKSKLNSLCDVIRNKNQTTDLIPIDEIPDKIDDVYFINGNKVNGEIQTAIVEDGQSVSKGDFVYIKEFDKQELDFRVEKLMSLQNDIYVGLFRKFNEQNNYDLYATTLSLQNTKLIKLNEEVKIVSDLEKYLNHFEITEYKDNSLLCFYQRSYYDESVSKRYVKNHYIIISIENSEFIISEEYEMTDVNNYFYQSNEDKKICLSPFNSNNNSILYYCKRTDPTSTDSFLCATFITHENDTLKFVVNDLTTLNGCTEFGMNADMNNIVYNSNYTQLSIDTDGTIKTPIWIKKNITDTSLYTSDTYAVASQNWFVKNQTTYCAGHHYNRNYGYDYNVLFSLIFVTLQSGGTYYGIRPESLTSEYFMDKVITCFSLEDCIYLVGVYNSKLRIAKINNGCEKTYIFENDIGIEDVLSSKIDCIYKENIIYLTVNYNDKTYLVSINDENRIRSYKEKSKDIPYGIAIEDGNMNDEIKIISL